MNVGVNFFFFSKNRLHLSISQSGQFINPILICCMFEDNLLPKGLYLGCCDSSHFSLWQERKKCTHCQLNWNWSKNLYQSSVHFLHLLILRLPSSLSALFLYTCTWLIREKSWAFIPMMCYILSCLTARHFSFEAFYANVSGRRIFGHCWIFFFSCLVIQIIIVLMQHLYGYVFVTIRIASKRQKILTITFRISALEFWKSTPYLYNYNAITLHRKWLCKVATAFYI